MTKSRQAYPTDVNDTQWNVIAPLLPSPAKTGRPREHTWREIVNAIFYITSSGCAWRLLPHEFPPWKTVYERLVGRVPIAHAGRDLVTVLPMHDNAGERAYQALKRGMDLTAVVVGLSAMFSVVPFIALLNALTSPGPLFYKQRRVGQGGQIFEMYKFRSMRPDAESGTGAVWARTRDDRITPVGRVVRKTRLDELPQFINVLKGEMSLIGPRPERPEFVTALSLIVPFYRARHAVKPGITGWAQIRYGYGNTAQHAHVKLEYDLYYVKRASPLLDMTIILQTLPVMALGKGT